MNRKRKGGKDFALPVLPSLKPRFIEKVMKRLPVIEDFITVVNNIGSSTHIP